MMFEIVAPTAKSFEIVISTEESKDIAFQKLIKLLSNLSAIGTLQYFPYWQCTSKDTYPTRYSSTTNILLRHNYRECVFVFNGLK